MGLRSLIRKEKKKRGGNTSDSLHLTIIEQPHQLGLYTLK